MAWCSKAVEMMCFFPLRRPSHAAESRAWLSASLPPEVKVISLGEAFRHLAMVSRALCSASAASCHTLWRLEGLP